MAGIRFPYADLRRIAGGLGLVLAFGILIGAAPLRDAPVVWYDDDQRNIPEPRERDPNLLWDGVKAGVVRPVGRVTHPGRLLRRIGVLFGGDHVPPAANVNRLDEVPNSSWFTNRIGLFPMPPPIAARGPGDGAGPARTERWTVVGAKTEGVTPGFRIRDARGDLYFIKFDPPGYSGMASSAGVISGRILHAAGYNVPEDDIVDFKREDLVVGEGVEMTLPDGSERIMTPADVNAILDRVNPDRSAALRAIASKFLDGVGVAGPFDWRGRRKDDPNDRVRHEDRRELRGLRMIAAWINHFDTKQHNTLDMIVEEDGRRFLRHHLIDFASSLGAGATGPAPTFGFEYSLDLPATLGRLLGLGFHEDDWRRLSMNPEHPEVGYFESEHFDPMEFKPLVPNTAFANLTARDGYWAAKIISAFTDRHLKAIVATGKYRQAASADYMVRILGERRDKVARHWFDRVPPLDFFQVSRGAIRFRDLGAERGIYSGEAFYRGRRAVVDADRRGGWSEWVELAGTEMDLTGGVFSAPVGDKGIGKHPFYAFEFQVNRGEGWSDGVTVYVARQSHRVVQVER